MRSPKDNNVSSKAIIIVIIILDDFQRKYFNLDLQDQMVRKDTFEYLYLSELKQIVLKIIFKVKNLPYFP